ncbi:putative glycolipid-binding domain-containing protein [Streptomyces sp. NPDC087300]|uniref:putative glycolipid-binding domain-containing protein n=1 Tax=Streptomyces sp. NPDC087300 TaxID=3365780 RepID=UPI003800AEEA
MAVPQSVLTWQNEESGGFETAWVDLAPSGLRARGRAVGVVPHPYWLDYELDTDGEFVTRRLQVTAEDAAGTRRLDLRRTDGGWTANGEPLPLVEGALDCDLGLCPLTNTMPVLRHGLHRGAGQRDFLMAWVSVPDLTVRPSRQTYTHLGPAGDGGAAVRYASGTYVSDLEFDDAGLVVSYPGIARRLAPSG